MTADKNIRQLIGNEKYSEMIEKSIICTDKTGRMKRAFSKDSVKIAFVGGSVTYGWHENDNSTEGNFPQLCGEYFQKKYPEKKIEILNCGISGTRCLMGMCVTDLKLAEFCPDLVVMEYAINEFMNAEGAKMTEGLFRQLLNLKSKPAVAVVSVFCKDGYSCEEMFSELSQHYEVAMAGLKTGVFPFVQNKAFAWEIYSNDEGHPTREGHQLISDCLCSLIEKSADNECAADYTLPAPLISDEYEKMKIYPLEKLGGNSKLREEILFTFSKGLFNFKTGSPLAEFSVDCKKLAVVFIQDSRDFYGNATVKIDGVKKENLQGNSIFGWHNPVAAMLIDDSITAIHKIEITMDKPDEKKEFCILAVMTG